MKAFSFRLEKALRWREAQAGVQKSLVAAALARVSSIEATITAAVEEAAGGAKQIALAPTPIGLASYAGFLQANRARGRRLQEQLAAAKSAASSEMERLIETRRKAHLLENLKSSEEREWRQEFERELERFAGEAFLTRRIRAPRPV